MTTFFIGALFIAIPLIIFSMIIGGAILEAKKEIKLRHIINHEHKKLTSCKPKNS